MQRLPTFRQPSWMSVPVLVVATISLILIGLPFGTGATASSGGAKSAEPVTAMHYVPVQTAFVAPVDLSIPKTRPTSLLTEADRLSFFYQDANYRPFVNEGPAEVDRDDADRRLQRAGKTWQLSDAFLSQVGADPYALPGVGFPNVETHGPKIKSLYKPYQAVLDWKLVDADDNEWTPIPAVYCMGLTAQQIAARAADFERQILSYAIEYGVSASLVKAVITKESCFDTKAVSSAGAEGLMQLMPETARWLKVTDRADVNQNLSAGIRYLADLHKRFGTEELALAAYNAGPGNVERHGGIPPFEETQDYVVSVMAHYRRYVATSRFANETFSN